MSRTGGADTRDPRTQDDRPASDSEPKAAVVAAPFRHGDLVLDYVVDGVLGSGGCGVVYRAHHRLLARTVAIKVLHAELADSTTMVERFVREAQAVNRIGHPNIVDIYDLGTLPDRRPFYVMEYVQGGDLEEYLRAHGRFTPAEALEVVEPVALALQAAHETGVIHRDVKATNVLVNRVNGRLLVKLHDFGVAKVAIPHAFTLTIGGERLGTPHAMAPEQIRDEPADARTDVYALGILLHRLLTGSFPFQSDDRAELEQMQLSAPPPRPSDLAPVSPAVDAVVLRCLEKERERRFPSMLEFVQALRDAVGGGARRAASGETPVVAVGIEAVFSELGEGIEDDVFLDEVFQILEHAEELFRAAGLRVALRASSVLIGARALPPGERGIVEAADALARQLWSEVEGAHAKRFRICVHCDTATLVGEEIVGGSLMQLGTWLSSDPARVGLFVTDPSG